MEKSGITFLRHCTLRIDSSAVVKQIGFVEQAASEHLIFKLPVMLLAVLSALLVLTASRIA